MGNSSTRLSIVVQPPLNSSSNGRHVAGSVMRGTVYIQCHADMNLNDVALQVRFKGKETSSVTYYDTVYDTNSDGDRTERQITRHAYSKRNIIEMDIPLALPQEGAVLNPGSYSYPFEFTLPLSLPSSMQMSAYGEGECEIRYKVEVDLKKRNSWGGGKDEDTEVLIMAAQPSSEPVGYFVQPTTEAIMACCCFNKGDVTFGANVDDTRVGCGEDLKVDFGCKNETGVDIQDVDAVVRQRITWYADHHSSTKEDIIAQRQFMQTSDMRALTDEELQQMEDNQSRSLRDDLLREIRQMVQDGSNSVSLNIPQGLSVHDTYHGALIHVTHELCITIQTPGCTSNPSVSIPLQIVTPAYIQVDDGEEPEEGGSNIHAPILDGWDTENVIEAEPVYAPSAPILGGNATSGKDEDEIVVDPFIDQMGGSEPPSLPILLKKLDLALSAKSTIQTLLKDAEWESIFTNLSPNDYASIMNGIKVEFDQAEVAKLVAENVENFTCEYVVAAYRIVVAWTREQLVRKLLPYCTDVKENGHVIMEELTSWERVCLERDFEQARSD